MADQKLSKFELTTINTIAVFTILCGTLFLANCFCSIFITLVYGFYNFSNIYFIGLVFILFRTAIGLLNREKDSRTYMLLVTCGFTIISFVFLALEHYSGDGKDTIFWADLAPVSVIISIFIIIFFSRKNVKAYLNVKEQSKKVPPLFWHIFISSCIFFVISIGYIQYYNFSHFNKFNELVKTNYKVNYIDAVTEKEVDVSKRNIYLFDRNISNKLLDHLYEKDKYSYKETNDKTSSTLSWNGFNDKEITFKVPKYKVKKLILKGGYNKEVTLYLEPKE